MSTAATLPGLQPDDLYRLRVAEDPRISPDARHVAFVLMHIDRDTYQYRRSIWLTEISDGSAAALTDGPNDQMPRWSPDGSRLAFIRTPPPGEKPKSQDEAAHGVGKGQLWLCDADGSNPRQLTWLPSGVTDPVWAPDGHSLVVTSGVGSADDVEAERAVHDGKSLPAVRTITRLWYRSDGSGYTYERRQQLFRVSSDGTDIEQLTSGDWDSRMPSFSPDGHILAFVSDRSADRFRWPGGAVWLQDLGMSRPPRRLTPESVSAGRPVWSPDGTHVAYRGTEVHTSDGYVELHLVGASGGVPRTLSEHFPPTCANVLLDDMRVPPGPDEPMWSDDGSEVWLLCSGFGSVHLWGVAIDGSGWRQITQGRRHVFAVSVDPSRRTLALGVSTPWMPGDVAVHDLATGVERQLTDLNAVLFKQRSLADLDEFEVVASDGAMLHGWIMRPADASRDARLPAVLEVHGGPMAMYGWSFCLEFQVLTALGMAVVFGNPRGSVGYGPEFARAIALHWGERDHRDLLEMMDAAIARGGIDEARLGVAGGSYGGYMTLWMLSHDPERRWQTGVAMRPLSNWATFFASSDIGVRFTLLEAGATPWEDPQQLTAHSPAAFVHRIEAPLLLMHSEQDLRCPIAESEQIFTALMHLGREVRFIRFEGQTHDLSRNGHPRSRELRLRHIAGWIDDHLVQRPRAAASLDAAT